MNFFNIIIDIFNHKNYTYKSRKVSCMQAVKEDLKLLEEASAILKDKTVRYYLFTK